MDGSAEPVPATGRRATEGPVEPGDPPGPEARVDEAFERARPRLFALAYRMTGSVGDADDVCQDTWIRWQRADRERVVEPEAYLVTVATRLAIDRSRAAHRRRERYVGPDLPEPVVVLEGTGWPAAPDDAAELADSLTFAFLVLLDRLTPVERAVLLLHDVFGYRFGEVAAVVDRTEAATRQLASRGRRKLAESGSPAPVDDSRARAVIDRLLVALAEGDVAAVMAELAPDVVLVSDGGPSRRAARRPVVTPDRVARLLVNLARRAEGVTVHVGAVNGAPGVVLCRDGAADVVLSPAFDDRGRVIRFYLQLNPDKLAHLTR